MGLAQQVFFLEQWLRAPFRLTPRIPLPIWLKSHKWGSNHTVFPMENNFIFSIKGRSKVQLEGGYPVFISWDPQDQAPPPWVFAPRTPPLAEVDIGLTNKR